MKKNIIIIVLLGITCAFGILLFQVTKNSDNKCKAVEKKVVKKETKKTLTEDDFIGYYVANAQVDNAAGEAQNHSIYLGLFGNNTAVITYKEDEVVKYIGGYKIVDNMIIIKSLYRNAQTNYGIVEDVHKISIGENNTLNYFTDELEGYKLEFNNIALTKIEKFEYDEAMK